jgi:hypothetical protein
MNVMERSGRQGSLPVVQHEISYLACEAVAMDRRERKSGVET